MAFSNCSTLRELAADSYAGKMSINFSRRIANTMTLKRVERRSDPAECLSSDGDWRCVLYTWSRFYVHADRTIFYSNPTRPRNIKPFEVLNIHGNCTDRGHIACVSVYGIFSTLNAEVYACKNNIIYRRVFWPRVLTPCLLSDRRITISLGLILFRTIADLYRNVILCLENISILYLVMCRPESHCKTQLLYLLIVPLRGVKNLSSTYHRECGKIVTQKMSWVYHDVFELDNESFFESYWWNPLKTESLGIRFKGCR